jgi:gamma-glutamyltranspeptidase / glutathione hydrolase
MEAFTSSERPSILRCVVRFPVSLARATESRPTSSNRAIATTAAALLALLATAVPSLDAVGKPAAGSRFAVATENESVSRAALRVMDRGGNAIDAAAAAALAAGVASPVSSGIGGGGFALVFSARSKRVTSLDFRERAPRDIDVGAFERRPLGPAQRGALVGVPGEVAGLYELHRQFGKAPWGAVVAPAIDLATNGFPVSTHLANLIAFSVARLAADGPLAELFVPNQKARKAGDRVKNPRLADTLKRVANVGPRAIYEGPIAEEIAATSKSTGGTLSTQDLAEYYPTAREPLHVVWDGNDVYTMGPPSGGGVMLAETLGMVTSAELRSLGSDSGAYTHLLAEVLRQSLADRLRTVSDPEAQAVDVARLLDPARLAMRRRAIDADHTHAIPALIAEEHGTHHIVVADDDGNVVTLTTTVNNPFGNALTTTTSGIVLNDELNDFTSKANASALGVAENPNRARPRARPVSSMTPTIVVRDGTPILALGGSGGMTIAPNVIEVLLARLVFGESPEQAVSAPRFSVPTDGSSIALEPTAKPELLGDLERRGEVVSIQKFTTHAVQMIAFENGRKLPASDPRKHGSALSE